MANADAALLWLRNLSPEAPRNKRCAFWCLFNPASFSFTFLPLKTSELWAVSPNKPLLPSVAVFFVLCLSKGLSNSARLQQAAPHLPTPLPMLGLQVCPHCAHAMKIQLHHENYRS